MAGPGVAREARSARLAIPNRVTLTVRTPHSGFNRMVVQVTVCAPGTDRCARIDDVMVDTGSTGLRLEASAVPSWLRLPAFLGAGDKPLAECLHFVHDRAWGALHRADLRIGGLTAANLPIQIIADGPGARPSSCPASDVRPTSNGTLGIGPALDDCRGACAQNPAHPGVYLCEDAGCAPLGGEVPPADRLPNPVARFPVHNNGIVFDLPAAPPGGTREIVGTLTFGVGTSPDNRLGSANIVRLDPMGHFTTRFGGSVYPESLVDSGTETFILPDASLPRCAGLNWAYCVAPERRFQADLAGSDGASVPLSFGIGDYATFRHQRFGASGSVAVAEGASSKTVVWGAPFFLGRRVSMVLTGMAVPGAPGLTGPLYAIEDSRMRQPGRPVRAPR